MIKGKVVAIDFDGTITDENVYPKISKLRPDVKDAINYIAKNNVVCIWTCREGRELEEAYNYLNKNEIDFHFMNACPFDGITPGLRKIIADYYIDDHNIFMDKIDWKKIKEYFMNNN